MISEQAILNLQYNNAITAGSPHVLMRPRVFPDGAMWCALYGEDLQTGVCGFGKTPEAACFDFDTKWQTQTLTPPEDGARDASRAFGGSELKSQDVEPVLRPGGVLERAFDGRAVRHEGRYHCLAYPCTNLTEWFYVPRNSHLCMDCIERREEGEGAVIAKMEGRS